MAMGQTAMPIIAISKATTAASEFFAVIKSDIPPSGGSRRPEVSARGNIVFEHVNFAYPSRPHVKILDDFNATFEAGKTTAIVGASGSGKSTVTALIERFYELDTASTAEITPLNYQNEFTTDEFELSQIVRSTRKLNLGGSLTAGGHDLNHLDLEWWRSQIGLVQQEPFLFNDTIYQNVAYGLVGSEWENESSRNKRVLVEEACKEVFAHEFIVRLPFVSETHNNKQIWQYRLTCL
jgi:ATP-binding cassette subfamily B (MDR/TAP) protein 1